MPLILAAALVMAQAAPSSVQPAAASAPAVAATPAVKPEKEKKICRADPTETGSHLVKRICLTRAQWDARNGASDADAYGAMQTSH
jgi:hypothetical protein